MPGPFRLFWNNDHTLRHNIFSVLCFCLAGSVFFTNLIHIHKQASKFQLTELIFLALIFFAPYKSIIQYTVKNNRIFLVIVSLYLFFDFLTSGLSGHLSSVLESCGRLYLLCLFAMLSYQFSTFSNEALLKRLTVVIITCSIAMIAIAITGYVLLHFNIRSSFLWPAGNYPYFGVLYRLSGPNQYPTMMVSLLTFGILYLLGIIKGLPSKRNVCVLLTLLFVCALATLSKSLVLLIMAVVILLLRHFKLLNKLIFTICLLSFTAVMVFFTHLIMVKHDAAAIAAVKQTIYTSDRVVYETRGYVFFEANYLTLKRAALRVFEEHPWLGIGTGNFSTELAAYKQKGLYPKKLPNFEPQTTFLRAFAENGIFGGILLLSIFGYVSFKFSKQPGLLNDDILFSLFLIFVVMVIEAIATDIFNFRHLWLLFAVSFTYMSQTKETNTVSTA